VRQVLDGRTYQESEQIQANQGPPAGRPVLTGEPTLRDGAVLELTPLPGTLRGSPPSTPHGLASPGGVDLGRDPGLPGRNPGALSDPQQRALLALPAPLRAGTGEHGKREIRLGVERLAAGER